MNRRVVLAVAVAVTMALGGCSWVAEDRSTPVGPADPGTEQNETSGAYERLANHTDALVDESYDLTITLEKRTPNGSLNATVSVASDPTAERQVIRTESANGTLDRYVAGNRSFTREVANGSTEYDSTDLGIGPDGYDAVHRSGIRVQRLASVYEFGEFESAGQLTRDGTQLEVFNLTGPATGPNATVTLHSSAGRILIGPDGVIHNATIDLRGTQRGEPFVYAVDYRIERVGDVSIAEPDWLDRARANETASDETAGQTTSRSG